MQQMPNFGRVLRILAQVHNSVIVFNIEKVEDH